SPRYSDQFMYVSTLPLWQRTISVIGVPNLFVPVSAASTSATVVESSRGLTLLLVRHLPVFVVSTSDSLGVMPSAAAIPSKHWSLAVSSYRAAQAAMSDASAP